MRRVQEWKGTRVDASQRYIPRLLFEAPFFFRLPAIESSASVVSSDVLLQLAKVHRVHVSSRMAFAHVTAGVRDVPRAITAVRAIEPRVLAALEFLMVGEPALPTEHARAIWTGEFPIEHSRVGRRNDGGAAAAAAVASVAASRSVHLLRAGPLLLMENVLPRFRDTGEPAIIHPWNRNKNTTSPSV